MLTASQSGCEIWKNKLFPGPVIWSLGNKISFQDPKNKFKALQAFENVALAIAVPYCGILFLKVLGRLDQLAI